MHHQSRLLPALLATCGLLVSCTTPPAPEAKAPLLPGFGDATLVTSSTNAVARKFFAQGMAQAYAFNAPEAVRAFKAGLAADPSCTLCAWGVAWQLGPNINAPDRGDLSEARRHIALAQRYAGSATPLERALLDALATRYGSPRDVLTDGPPGADICGPARGDRAHPLDIAYAERLRGLADLLPDDADVISLYAEAEMIATRDDWWDEKTGKPAGRIGELADRLDRALRTQPNHTGLNHYMVHTMDSSVAAARATAAADRLGALAPASPHLLHMPAHIYVKIGRFADAVRVNQEALAAEVKLTETIKAQQQEPVWNWDRHNLHFLWFAALMEDQGELALSTARRVAELSAKATSPYGAYRRGLPMLTLARLQRWDEVLKEPELTGPQNFGKALTLALHGLALVNTGQLEAARGKAVELARIVEAADPKGARPTELNAAASPMVRTVQGWLDAEIAWRSQRPADALAALDKATAAEDELGGEPPILAAGTRLLRGQGLLRAGRYAEAEAAFRDDLRLHPANVWGVRGLAQAQQGAKAQAAARQGLRLARG
jgi:tetratricopeptide (TPR) repeat protein